MLLLSEGGIENDYVLLLLQSSLKWHVLAGTAKWVGIIERILRHE